MASRRAGLAAILLVGGCAVARGPSPGHPPLCVAIGQAHALVGSPTGAFPRAAPSCRADGGAMSTTLETLLAAAISTVAALAVAGVF